MLILTRQIGERVLIGNDIVVSVEEVRGGQVRLGIRAPRSVQVDREEVVRRKAAELDAARERES